MGFHKRWLMNDSLIDMYRDKELMLLLNGLMELMLLWQKKDLQHKL
jgi:hypothetical protein